MKISAKLLSSQDRTTVEFDLEDLNMTPDRWESSTESERMEAVREAVYSLNDQPYWVLDKFKTKD